MSWIEWTFWSLGGFLVLVTLHDLLQRKHAILRNFPIIGHFLAGKAKYQPATQAGQQAGKRLQPLFATSRCGRQVLAHLVVDLPRALKVGHRDAHLSKIPSKIAKFHLQIVENRLKFQSKILPSAGEGAGGP